MYIIYEVKNGDLDTFNIRWTYIPLSDCRWYLSSLPLQLWKLVQNDLSDNVLEWFKFDTELVLGCEFKIMQIFLHLWIYQFPFYRVYSKSAVRCFVTVHNTYLTMPKKVWTLYCLMSTCVIQHLAQFQFHLSLKPTWCWYMRYNAWISNYIVCQRYNI